MVIVSIKGGLGNQMFQFSFLLKFLLEKKEVKLDISSRLPRINSSGIELTNVFKNIIIPFAGVRDIFFFVEKVRNEIGEHCFKLKEGKFFIKETRDDEFKFQPDLRNFNQTYFQGYWQHLSYFKEFKDELLYYFEFPPISEEDMFNRHILSKISKHNSVSVHIRRGDYRTSNFHKVLNVEYYNEAIRYIRCHIKNPYFFVFSDDQSWALDNFNESDMMVITENIGDSSYIDMQLMSLCKHNIIANSTFSWWSAWLNINSEKIVIAPRIWFIEEIDMSCLLLDEWVLL